MKEVDILKGTAGQLMKLIQVFLQPQNSVYEKGQKAYKGQRAQGLGLLSGHQPGGWAKNDIAAHDKESLLNLASWIFENHR